MEKNGALKHVAGRTERAVSLAAVAEAAGVSKATASRALRASSLVSPATARRVRDAASALGYQPHPVWGSLLSEARMGRSPGRHANIALLNFRPSPPDWHELSYYRRIMDGIRRRAQELRFSLDEIFLDDPKLGPRRLEAILKARAIRGIVIPPLTRTDLRIEWSASAFAIVGVGYHLQSPRVHRVAPDNHYNLQLAWRQLKRSGARRIGLALHGPIDAAINHAWTEAYHTAQAQQDSQAGAIPPFLSNPLDLPRLRHWLEAHGPDAVIFGQRAIRDAIVLLSRETGKPPPTLTDLNWRPEHDGCPGVDQQLQAVGEAAIDVLATQLYMNQTGLPRPARATLIEGTWKGI